MMIQKNVLTTKELALYTGYSINYIYKLVYERKIPFYKPPDGRRLFFIMEEIEKWLLTNAGQTIDKLLK